MLRTLRRQLESRGVVIRRTSANEGFDSWRDLRKLLEPAPGDVAFDVGANCGQTVRAIRRSFPTLAVHAFEPIAESLRQGGAQCAGLGGVSWMQAAVGNAQGEVTLYSEGSSQLASLRDTLPQAGRVANTVPLLSLDEYAAANGIASVLILKTDTEGFDLAVLEGAQRLPSARRVAAVLCEVGFWPGDRTHTPFADVQALLAQHRFVLAGFYDLPGFWHLRDWGCTFGNALFVRRDLIGH